MSVKGVTLSELLLAIIAVELLIALFSGFNTF